MGASALLDQFLDPFSQCLDAESARRVACLHVSAPVQERVDFLAERAKAGQLSGEEQDEYEALVNAADIISILQLKARQRFSSAGR
jgi:hypothetical protein